VIVAWILVAVGSAPLASKLADATKEEYARPDGSQSKEVGDLLAARFAGGDTTPMLLVYRREGGLTDADRQAIVDDAREASEVPLVGTPVPPFGSGAASEQVSASGDVAFTVLPLAPGKVSETTDTIAALRELAASGEGLESHLTGSAPLLNDLTNIIKEADSRLLLTTGLLVLVLLFLIYRSPLLAIVPLAVVALSYVITNAILYALATYDFPVTSNAASLLLVLMFGVGTDYCLLVINRYASELRTTESPPEALAASLPLTAPAIVASAATVIVALLTLLASILSLNRAFAPVNAIGIALVMLASLTLLPAILSLLGRRAFWPRAGRVAFDPAAPAEPARESFVGRIGRRALRRPGRSLVVSVAVLLVCALGVFAYEPNADVIGQFRADTDGTRGYDAIQAGFSPGVVGPTTALVVRTEGAVTDGDVEAARTLLAAGSGVAAVSAVKQRSDDGGIVALTMTMAGDPYSNEALDRVAELRENADRTLGPDVRVVLGDGSASRLDYREGADRDAKVVAPLVLAAIFLVLVILLRAVVAPLYLCATLLLSYFATLGLSLLFFKHVLDQDSVDPELPLIAFVFLVALGSDYTIFLMTRVREEAVEHGTREGALRALSATGPVITGAGIILAGTFSVLTVVPFWFLLELGIVVALGILIDTFLVRTIVVPALVLLFGDRSWWPFASPAEEVEASAAHAS